ncbi:hypothetical protein B0H13DRAFT_1883937 [Mycena leptocephala]|nr:hypothetical protein B0H13DRAFT_1883937 [Mycena leptocephala]
MLGFMVFCLLQRLLLASEGSAIRVRIISNRQRKGGEIFLFALLFCRVVDLRTKYFSSALVGPRHLSIFRICFKFRSINISGAFFKKLEIKTKNYRAFGIHPHYFVSNFIQQFRFELRRRKDYMYAASMPLRTAGTQNETARNCTEPHSANTPPSVAQFLS